MNCMFFSKMNRICNKWLASRDRTIFLKWVKSEDEWANRNLLFSAEWVVSFGQILEKDKGDVLFDRFFIYLYGIAIDLKQKTGTSLAVIKKQRLESETKLQDTIERLFSNDMQSKKFFLKLNENLGIIKKVYKTIGDEQSFNLIYYRNKYCHPFLTEYGVKAEINKSNGLISFDSIKYDKLKNGEVVEVDFFEGIWMEVIKLKDDIKKLSDNLYSMRNS